jgi:multiple sugar transport system permease protein
LLTQARALRTLPGWTTEVEVYYGTAPLVNATAPPLSPDDLQHLDSVGGRWRDGAALVPLKDRDGREIVGAVAARPLRVPSSPLPGGIGFVWPAAVLAVAGAAAISFRGRSLRRGGYLAAALVLAAASYLDVRDAARSSTDRWLTDTRRLLQEAATRLPPPRSRVSVSDLAALVQDAELVAGEPGESAPRRLRLGPGGAPRAVVAVLIGAGRWVELRSVPAELGTARWLLLLLPCALVGPSAIYLLRWAERTAPRTRRETAIAWGFLAPAALHLLVFTLVPLVFAVYLALPLSNFTAVIRDPRTWLSMRDTALYALYVPLSVAIALVTAVCIHRYSTTWGARLLRSVLVLPYITSVVAMALLWQLIDQTGTLGLGRSGWLSSPGTALAVLALLSIYAQVGGQTLVFLAALAQIPRDFLDAARIEGVGAWRGFWRITLPLLRPVVWFVGLTSLVAAFQVFTIAFVLPERGPLVLVQRAYQLAWGGGGGGNVGMASAFAILLYFALVVFTWPQLRLLKSYVRHS